MSITTISTPVLNGVVLSTGNYGATLTVTETGYVTGSPAAVDAVFAGNSVINAGEIHSNDIGVYIRSGAMTNDGIINAGTTGVEIKYGSGGNYNPSNLSFDGRIYGVTFGVALVHGSFTNSASIGSHYFGATVQEGSFTNTAAGSISGGTTGLFASDSTVVNAGTITGNAGGAGLHRSGIFINTGNIAGFNYGFYLYDNQFLGQSSAVLDNSGRITGFIDGAGMVGGTIINSCTILGRQDGILLTASSYAAAIVDSGYIGGGSYAIDAVGIFALTLGNHASLSGKVIDRSGAGLLALSGGGSIAGLGGSITGFTTIDFAAGAAWTLEGSTTGLAAGQVINGFAIGDTLVLDGFAAASATVEAGGLVLSNGVTSETLAGSFYSTGLNFSSVNGNTAIYNTAPSGGPVTLISRAYNHPITLATGNYTDQLTITNTGAVLSPSAYVPALYSGVTAFQTIQLSNAGYVDGFKFDWYGYVTNSTGGTIHGGYLRSGEVVNDGLVTGRLEAQSGTIVNDGVMINNAVTVTNSTMPPAAAAADLIVNNGSIYGASVAVDVTFGTLINDGVIRSPGRAVYVVDSTVVNAGTIAGELLALSGVHLIVEPGAVFTGQVAGLGGASDSMTLAGSISGSLDVGGAFYGFQNIDFAAGAQWRLEGTSSELANRQSITGFAQSDNIQLDGFAASSGTFIAGTGLVLSDGASTQTLGIQGSFATGDFIVSASNGNTDIGLAITTISSTVQNGITLASGQYINVLTVTGTGAVLSSAGPAITTPVSETQTIQLTNAGYIEGISFGGYSTIYNSGTVNGIYTHSGMVTNAGVVLGGLDMIYGTAENSGTITSAVSFAVNFNSAMLINTGTIRGAMHAVQDLFGTVINYGLIESTDETVMTTEGMIINAGTIIGGIGGLAEMTVVSEPGAVFEGLVGSDIADSSLVFAGTTAGSLNLGGSFSNFEFIDFAVGSTWALEGNLSELAGGQSITGFAMQDTIQLDGFSVSSETFFSGTGLVLSNGTSSETLGIQGSFATSDFTVTNTAEGVAITTDASVACFCTGTRIATSRGEVAVEELVAGDLVRTASQGMQPIKWIGRRAYDGRFLSGNHLALPVRIRRDALGAGVPSRDLFVSPDHALAEGGVLVHAWRFINGVSVTQAESVERVEYFHVELENHAVIFAENTPVESFLDNGTRARFQNAPQKIVMQEACLPRVEDGYYLARLKQRIDALAGIFAPNTTGMLRGRVDETGAKLRGWAQDLSAPEAPVELELLCAGVPVMRFLANRYRVDLRKAGLGSGCHAFEIALPALGGTITLRRVAEGAVLGQGVMATRRAG